MGKVNRGGGDLFKDGEKMFENYSNSEFFVFYVNEAGEYTCATVRVGLLSVESNVVILSNRPFIDSSLGRDEFLYGESVTFICRHDLEGKNIVISWTKDDLPLPESG